MPLVVQSVDQNSVAQQLGLGPGCLLVSIDGNPLCDALDYQFYTAAERFTLTVCENGSSGTSRWRKRSTSPWAATSRPTWG